jgi:hypothetical protein
MNEWMESVREEEEEEEEEENYFFFLFEVKIIILKN